MNVLRYWMFLAEGKIVYRDHTLVVILNPSKREFDHLLTKAEEGDVRAILSDNDLYVWDAYHATHDEIGRKLAISIDAELHLMPSSIELDPRRSGNAEMIPLHDARKLADRVKANSSIVRIYGPKAQVYLPGHGAYI